MEVRFEYQRGATQKIKKPQLGYTLILLSQTT